MLYAIPWEEIEPYRRLWLATGALATLWVYRPYRGYLRAVPAMVRESMHGWREERWRLTIVPLTLLHSVALAILMLLLMLAILWTLALHGRIREGVQAGRGTGA